MREPTPEAKAELLRGLAERAGIWVEVSWCYSHIEGQKTVYYLCDTGERWVDSERFRKLIALAEGNGFEFREVKAGFPRGPSPPFPALKIGFLDSQLTWGAVPKLKSGNVKIGEGGEYGGEAEASG